MVKIINGIATADSRNVNDSITKMLEKDFIRYVNLILRLNIIC